MTFVVRELAKAKQDKRSIFHGLQQRSPAGAAAWLDAYDAAIDSLSRDAESHGEAMEARDCDVSIRQALFKTRRGRVYRIIYFIERSDVFVLRIRGPGQAPVLSLDL